MNPSAMLRQPACFMVATVAAVLLPPLNPVAAVAAEHAGCEQGRPLFP
jgi:hypothetical protein